ncbi:MAG: AMP-binding protein [Verrucomicrobia bacterium]|nr:AMP-binding protein [Verrucomicrobiota bacterium]
MNRSLEMAIWLLAVLKCGAAYVPMDPAFPRDRLGAMMADAGIPILVTESSLANRLPHAKRRWCGWINRRLTTEGRAELTGGGNMLRDTAYVIFTSGSTGRPKGVQIPQRALINFLESMRREPGMDADDVLLAVTTPSFDIAGLELLLPLVAGGSGCDCDA